MATLQRSASRRTRTRKTLQFPPRAQIPNLPTETLRLMLDRLNLVTMGRCPDLISRLLAATPEDHDGRRDEEHGDPERDGSGSGEGDSADGSPWDTPHVMLHPDADSSLEDPDSGGAVNRSGRHRCHGDET